MPWLKAKKIECYCLPGSRLESVLIDALAMGEKEEAVVSFVFDDHQFAVTESVVKDCLGVLWGCEVKGSSDSAEGES